jgi:excisionase family DNA binding protein
MNPLEDAGSGLDRYVTIPQAMALASVSRRTIYNWLALGTVEYVRTPGGRVRIWARSLFTPPPAADLRLADRPVQTESE